MIEKRKDEFGEYLFVKSNSMVNIEDMIAGIQYLENDNSLPRKLRIIEDARSAEVNFSPIDASELSEHMHKVALKYDYIKHAVIHSNPRNTAMAMLVQKNKKDQNYFLEVFSTFEGAIHWLKNS